jgi:hypothetical protein
MSTGWFDPDTGAFALDDYAVQLPSYKRIIERGAVTEHDIEEQLRRTGQLLRDLESMLSPEAHALATEALCELGVLHAIERLYGHPGALGIPPI